MSGVEFVDYSHTGFAVVFATAGRPASGEVALAIRSSRVGARIEPDRAAVGAAGRISVRNATSEAHVLSYPAGRLVQRLAPEEEVEIAVAAAGEQALFVLDEPNSQATIFAAPGPFSVVSAAGRYVLDGLSPGRGELHVWHPRFPPAATEVELPEGDRVHVDFELSVDREDHVHAH
jgi:hypothetical protein